MIRSRIRNADGGRVRRLGFTLEQPVGRDMKTPLADLLDEATTMLGMLGAGEPGTMKKKRWLARWSLRVVCEAILRQKQLLPLPWSVDLHSVCEPPTHHGHSDIGVVRKHLVTIELTPKQYAMVKRVAEFDQEATVAAWILNETEKSVISSADCFDESQRAHQAAWDGKEEA